MPQIVDETYERGDQFALFFAITAASMAAGSLLNSSLVQRFGMRSISHGAMLAFCGIGIVFLIVTLTTTPNIWLMVFMVGSMMLNFGFIVSNFNSIAMEPLGHIAGSAAAVMGGVNFAGGAFLGSIAGQMFDGTIVPMASAFCFVGIVAVVVVLITERGKLFGT